ncbi:hypothetical protein EDD21DRAFT_370315 [Dissophora ornata]|nr:hypothetical protein EDD21DRAFT_370315 [Dissophora ornata]
MQQLPAQQHPSPQPPRHQIPYQQQQQPQQPQAMSEAIYQHDQMHPQGRPYQPQQFQQPAAQFMNRTMPPPPNGQSLQLSMTSTPMSIPMQQQPLSQSSSPVMSTQNAMKGGQSPMNGDNSPMTDGSSIMTSTPPGTAAGAVSPVLSPTNGGIKKPKLRVHIPIDAKENNTLAGPMIKEEESSELPPIQKRPLESAPMSSTLPSQFAKNLPSPSTFYPEFYAAQSELSPIVFGQTPTSAQPSSAFNWPVPRERELSRVHQPSPLAKGQNVTVASSSSLAASSTTAESSPSSSSTTSGSKGSTAPGSNLRITSTSNSGSVDPSDVSATRSRSTSGDDDDSADDAPSSKKSRKD